MDGSGVNNPMIRVSNRSFQVMVSRKTILRAEGVVSYAFQGGEPTFGESIFSKRRLPMKNSTTAITSKCRMLFRQTGIFWMMNGVLF